MRLTITTILLALLSLVNAQTAKAQQRIDGHQYLLQRRPLLAERDTNFLRQNFFMLGVGAEAIVRTGYQKSPLWGTVARLVVGRWCNSISGVRFGLAGAFYHRITQHAFDDGFVLAVCPAH